MAMELLRLSKFKLQLLALITETRDLRERERTARDELLLANQKQKQSEAEYARKLQELHSELASRDEMQRKLETKVRYLENEHCLLGKKEKELKETINNLLQSRESFMRHYEDSTCSLRRSIEVKDRKLAVLSEKIQAHLLLFDSIEKEAAAVKQVLDNVWHLINEKEKVVTELKGKMEQVSTYEKDFIEKIHFLENKVADYQHELRKRDSAISELREYLNAEKFNSNAQLQIEELQKTLSVKDDVIKKLTSDKKALHLELHSLELTVRKIEESVNKMSAEDQKTMVSVMEGQEVYEITSREENESSENQATGGDSPIKNTPIDCKHAAMSVLQVPMLGNDPSCHNHIISSCPPKSSGCASQSDCLCPSTINTHSVATDVTMGNCIVLVQHVDSECSTTGTEALEAAPT